MLSNNFKAENDKAFRKPFSVYGFSIGKGGNHVKDETKRNLN